VKPVTSPTPFFLLVCLLFLSLLAGCSLPAGTPAFLSPTPGPSHTPHPPTASPTLTRLEIAQATQNARGSIPSPTPKPDESLMVVSPDGQIEVRFFLHETQPRYSVTYRGREIILASRLGFTFRDQAPMDSGLVIADSQVFSRDETWTQPWGEMREVRDHHNELRVLLSQEESGARKLMVVFRVFDDGFGFRYEFPSQPDLADFEIMDELTTFAIADNPVAWWIPAFQQYRYEYLYSANRLSELPVAAPDGVHTPLTMRTDEGLHLSIHEAALYDYSSMTLLGGRNGVLEANLVPWSDGVKVRGSAPFKTPWRTVQIADDAGGLITSNLILNLNEPNVLGDVSWVQPGKYVGVWWGMIIGKWSWGSGPNHGATTANVRRTLDFAAANGFDSVLVEGWNIGWDGEWWTSGGAGYSFTTPYPDYDLRGMAAYAESLGVTIIGHNETAGGIANYESQMEEAFALYEELGINRIKTGYVAEGQGIPRYDEAGNLLGMEWHHGQYMVQHYQKVVETAARYHIMVNVHEPIKDTGIRRTYPNMVAREGARGQEYNAFGGNPPDHVTVLPFTRMLAGPMDYTPGVLKMDFPEYRTGTRVSHTLAKELALYVVIYSPLQMAADLIDNYAGQPAFQFIKDVAVDWEETRVLNAFIGEYVTIIRKERDGDEWFMGSITNEAARNFEAALDFLDPGVTYVAEIYADGKGAHWETNPYALDVRKFLVDSETLLNLDLAPGGGQAVRFYPASEEEARTLERYGGGN